MENPNKSVIGKNCPFTTFEFDPPYFNIPPNYCKSSLLEIKESKVWPAAESSAQNNAMGAKRG